MGGVKKITIPDYKTYQIGPWAPELQEVERKLKARGLKDPWLRNEVWRFDRRDFLTPKQRALVAFKRGFFPGLALAIISACVSSYYENRAPHHTPYFAGRPGVPDDHGHH